MDFHCNNLGLPFLFAGVGDLATQKDELASCHERSVIIVSDGYVHAGFELCKNLYDTGKLSSKEKEYSSFGAHIYKASSPSDIFNAMTRSKVD